MCYEDLSNYNYLLMMHKRRSFYSKFYKEPLEDLTVVTFCDGCFKLTETSKTSKGCQDLHGSHMQKQ